MGTAEILTRIEARLTALVAWSETRIDGDEQRQAASDIEALAFTIRQIIPILRGARDDLVLLRADISNLRAAFEAPNADRVESRLTAIETALMTRARGGDEG